MIRLIVLLILVPSLLFSADFKYLVDMRSAVLDELGLSTTTTFYTSAKLNRFINRGIKFVEDATKTNQATIGYQLDGTAYRFALTDTTLSFNGVDYVYLDPAGENAPYGLAYKPLAEFKTDYKTAQVYTVWDSVVYTNLPPDADDFDSLYVLAWKVGFDLTADSSLVPLPRGWKRELAVLYALKLCAEAEHNDQKATRLWNEWKEKWQIATGVPFKQPEQSSPINP